jgi:hypothetical protein
MIQSYYTFHIYPKKYKKNLKISLDYPIHAIAQRQQLL